MSAETDPRLAAHRTAWERKASVRAVYKDYYRRLWNAMPSDDAVPGPVLEVGAGSGHSSAFLKSDRIRRFDILPSPWVDLVSDAQALPYPDASLAGLYLIDVLHHIERPVQFFREAARALKPGGRIAMIEPGITPLSWLFYHFIHEEPVDMSIDPLDEPEAATPFRDPFDSNQAIPTLLFKRLEFRQRLIAKVPELKTLRHDRLSLFAYPMTGGFGYWSLIPAGAVAPLLRFEEKIMPALGLFMAFRLFIVLEKRA